MLERLHHHLMSSQLGLNENHKYIRKSRDLSNGIISSDPNFPKTLKFVNFCQGIVTPF